MDNHANLMAALSANTGSYDKQQDHRYWWQLSDVYQVVIAQTVQQNHHHQQALVLPIAPNHVHLLTKDADDLSVTDLYAHKQLMAQQNLRSLQHELNFWQKLFSPLAILSLVLVATSFVFGSVRTYSLGLRMVVALLVGLLFSYLSDLSAFVSLATKVSPLLMTVLPIVLSATVGMWLLTKH